MDETMDFVSCSEAVGFAFAVLRDAVEEIVCDSDVEGSGFAGEDVDVVLVLVETHGGRLARLIGDNKGKRNSKDKSNSRSSASRRMTTKGRMTTKRKSAQVESRQEFNT